MEETIPSGADMMRLGPDGERLYMSSSILSSVGPETLYISPSIQPTHQWVGLEDFKYEQKIQECAIVAILLRKERAKVLNEEFKLCPCEAKLIERCRCWHLLTMDIIKLAENTEGECDKECWKKYLY